MAFSASFWDLNWSISVICIGLSKLFILVPRYITGYFTSKMYVIHLGSVNSSLGSLYISHSRTWKQRMSDRLRFFESLLGRWRSCRFLKKSRLAKNGGLPRRGVPPQRLQSQNVNRRRAGNSDRYVQMSLMTLTYWRVATPPLSHARAA